MSPEEFSNIFPHLYHMAEFGTWESIRRHGLLSTTALLDLYEVSGMEREALEDRHRPESVRITNPRHGSAVVRDQKPMSDQGLKKCLDGMKPREWYRLLNQKVFFWVSEERLVRLLKAKAYRDRQHTVLTVNTPMLLEYHLDKVWLSPMNSGCTRPFPHPRGPNTFSKFSEYPFLNRRRYQELCVELAVSYSLPDISRFVVRVEHRKGEEILETIL
jgi:hypothetical protein